jgi:hypothetical protein
MIWFVLKTMFLAHAQIRENIRPVTIIRHVLKGETSKRNGRNQAWAETIETTETKRPKRNDRNSRNETAENINYRKNGKY